MLHLEVCGTVRGTLYAAVLDGSGAIPVARRLDIDAESGRGLHVVQHLANRWGVEADPGGGKRVWAELRWRSGISPDSEDESPTLRESSEFETGLPPGPA